MTGGQGSMTSTQPCRLHEWMTEVGELKTEVECPTLGLVRCIPAKPLASKGGRLKWPISSLFAGTSIVCR